LVYAMATRGGVTPVGTLLLSGIAVTSLLTAISSLVLSLNIVNWQIAQEIVRWTRFDAARRGDRILFRR